MNNYKLKHLSRFCCHPANELEFEAVKMAAEIGKVEWYDGNCVNHLINYHFLSLDIDNELVLNCTDKGKEEIPCLDFINKLRMSEEESRELENDRVAFSGHSNVMYYFSTDQKIMFAREGHYFKTNEDGTEVTLHKK